MPSLNDVYRSYVTDASRLNDLCRALTAYVVAVCKRSGQKDADDRAQEVVTKVWLSLATFKANSSFKTWVYSITRRHLIDAARRQPDPWLLGEDLDGMNQTVTYDKFCGGPDSELLSKSERLLVDTLLNTGDFERTAEVLQTTPLAVRSKLERIKRKLATKKPWVERLSK